MTTLLIILVFGLIGLVAWWAWRSRGALGQLSHGTENFDTLAAWPPSATRVLTHGEREAYDLLRLALPAHMVLAQVPLHRFVKVPTRNSYSEWLRRVGRLHADLVVCDRHSQVVAVVEILSDDDAPASRVQRRRDRMIRVLKATEIPVHVWRASALPPVDAAREAILPGATSSDFQPTGTHVQARGFGAAPNFAASAAQATASEEPSGLREPPPSTWFDDLDSESVPLTSSETKALESRGRSSR